MSDNFTFNLSGDYGFGYTRTKESPGKDIPDKDIQGIERSMSTDKTGQVKEIDVAVDITHTFIGDLIITLSSPSTTSVDLHNRSGGSTDNLIKTFDLSTTPSLSKFVGEPITGSWKLKVADVAGKDLGKLNHWSLKIIT